MNLKDRSGFTLVEVLIYAAVFAVSSVFLVQILTTVTRTQLKQTSANEVNAQVSFVAETIQRLVRESALVENDSGVATTTLRLRTTASSTDPTLVYVDASNTAIYLQQGSQSAVALTDDRVTVGNFSITKFENVGASAVVQVDLTLNYNTSAEQSKASQTWRGAITRVSAATFDSSILPSSDGALNLGGSSSRWQDGYFAGSLGLGTSPVSTAKIKSTGNVGFTTSTVGLVLVSPGGTCFRLGISNAGVYTTSTVTCP
jgi:type II secretory pathway component PulJ